MFDELKGGTCILGRRFHLVGSSEGGIFRFRRLQLGLRNSGRHSHLEVPFSGSESFVGKLRGRQFSDLERAWLCFTNSGAALVSWGADFTWLRAPKVAFSG